MRLLCVLALFFSVAGYSQTGTSSAKINNKQNTVADSAALAKPQTTADTLPAGIRMPDSLRHNRFIDTLFKTYGFDPYALSWHRNNPKALRTGTVRPAREGWVIAVILFLLVYTAVLNRLIGKDLYNVVQAFYLKRSLVKLTREDNLLTSWAYIFLFALFGFTFGLYIYQIILYYNLTYTFSGFQLFVTCSVFVVLLFILKILVARILGFMFNVQRLTGEYVTILYLTYFNIAFIFLPVVICFSLISPGLTFSLLVVSVVLIVAVFIIQYVRSTLNIISNFTFPKIYLFVYFCALEICPVLILIKALKL